MSEPGKLLGGFLLDTNVLSEMRKKSPDPRVVAFIQSADAAALYVSVLTIGELRKGVIAKRREDEYAAERLSDWVDGLESSFADRILTIDIATADLWGRWSAERPRPVVDILLAATASTRQLVLVTRNLRDMEGLNVRTLNPWDD